MVVGGNDELSIWGLSIPVGAEYLNAFLSVWQSSIQSIDYN